MLTSAGVPERAKHGKQVLTYTIIGLAIAFGSWMIINTTIGTLAKYVRNEQGEKVGQLKGIAWPWNGIRCIPGEATAEGEIKESHFQTLVDTDGNGKASPGDTLQYSFAYTNVSSRNLSDLVIASDYDQEHIFAIINIPGNGKDDGDKVIWSFDNLEANQSIILSYDFILDKDFSDLLSLGEIQKLDIFTILSKPTKSTIGISTTHADSNEKMISLQNIIVITSSETKKKTFNDPIVVTVLTNQFTLGDPEDIVNNPVYLVGYYEEPDDSSSKWSSYDWYFNQLTNNGVNAIRLAFYNSENPFYSVSPWVSNNCAQPNDNFYTNWLKSTIDKANSKGLYVILTLYQEKTDWSCDNRNQENRNKTYDKIINYLNLPKDKVIIEINWEQKIVSNEWLQNQAKYFEYRGIPTIITNWHYDDNYGAGNAVGT